MYRLFYNYKVIGDVLLIVIDDKIVTSKKEINDLVLLYNNEELIGINILNFSNIVKTKAKGMIINPPKELIDIINHMLVNANEKKLPYLSNSGFVIGKIKSIDNDVASIDIGIDIKTNIDETQYNKDDYVVIALPNVILANGKITKDYKIVNSDELGFEENENIEFNDKVVIGEDYFKEI